LSYQPFDADPGSPSQINLGPVALEDCEIGTPVVVIYGMSANRKARKFSDVTHLPVNVALN